MIRFLVDNLATILISAAILGVVVWIVVSMVRRKQSGKAAGCGCGCSGCPNSSLCHGGKG